MGRWLLPCGAPAVPSAAGARCFADYNLTAELKSHIAHALALLTPAQEASSSGGEALYIAQDKPVRCAGKTVLELGCGSGLLGVILARLGAHAVLTDGSAPTLANCMHNLHLNGVAAQRVGPAVAAEVANSNKVSCAS